jgi:hypothetical protein
LDFKCVKHNHTQVLDHFPERSRAHVQRVDSEAPVHDGDQASTTADSHSLHWDSDSDLWETEAEWAANAKQQWRKQKTFTQVYWVCDAAWPKSDRNKQVRLMASVINTYFETIWVFHVSSSYVATVNGRTRGHQACVMFEGLATVVLGAPGKPSALHMAAFKNRQPYGAYPATGTDSDSETDPPTGS